MRNTDGHDLRAERTEPLASGSRNQTPGTAHAAASAAHADPHTGARTGASAHRSLHDLSGRHPRKRSTGGRTPTTLTCVSANEIPSEQIIDAAFAIFMGLFEAELRREQKC